MFSVDLLDTKLDTGKKDAVIKQTLRLTIKLEIVKSKILEEFEI